MPLYDIQTQDKLEFKKFLRLQREGLVNIKDIFQKMFGVVSQAEREEYLRILTIIRDRLREREDRS